MALYTKTGRKKVSPARILNESSTFFKHFVEQNFAKPMQIRKTHATPSSSNFELIQTAQSKILRTIARAPWYVRNENIHNGLQIPFFKNKFNRAKGKYSLKLEMHPNCLARHLANR